MSSQSVVTATPAMGSQIYLVPYHCTIIKMLYASKKQMNYMRYIFFI